MYTQRVTWEKLRSLDTSTMSSSTTYYPIGTALLYPCYKLKIVNNSNVLVTISIDGANDFDVVPAGSFFLYDEYVTTLREFAPQGTQFSAKSASAGTGLIYLSSQYLVIS